MSLASRLKGLTGRLRYGEPKWLKKFPGATEMGKEHYSSSMADTLGGLTGLFLGPGGREQATQVFKKYTDPLMELIAPWHPHLTKTVKGTEHAARALGMGVAPSRRFVDKLYKDLVIGGQRPFGVKTTADILQEATRHGLLRGPQTRSFSRRDMPRVKNMFRQGIVPSVAIISGKTGLSIPESVQLLRKIVGHPALVSDPFSMEMAVRMSPLFRGY